ncbi:putative glycerophosphoryl diester phosphodiesterase 1 [Caulifigura coniformis]|uniref:Putative glycerophosphoryl diester phosphodiesterase 1 n=1 Tax=Caulifigura coniformis TaxID=2527983 RepID=A0A517SH55_9PLAN|nr:glycerophosphodiester phosphodiesterase family protein [Caulifigura coniformis]QDT55459.1 putative glycerophosphoryl diester phosphodiesterase 1 [Caulifigura coniformis]
MNVRRFLGSLVVLGSALVALVGAHPASGGEKTPIILAHRGGAYEYEENTMEGFRACYERGIRGFETDVRMTKDGVLVILHDDTLDRTHNGTGSVEHKTAAELRDVTTKKKGQKMLFLDELLDYFADKPDVYIEWEMKVSNKDLYPNDRISEYCQKLYTAAEKKKAKGSVYVYSSFDERPLKAIDAIAPAAPMSLIAGKPCSAEFIQKAKAVGADRIACQINGSSRASIKEAQKAGLMVNGWPGRGAQDYQLAIGLGLDVHCTDVPVAVIAVKEQIDK